MLKIFLISLFASVAFAGTDECNEARRACYTHDPTVIPQNAAEHDALCEANIKLYQCLLETVSQCGDNMEENAYDRESLIVLNHTCDKESELYSNIVLVQPCLTKEVLEKKNYNCHIMFEEESTKEKFEKILNNAGITDVGRDHECFETYFFDACAIGSNGAICGEVARDVALDIIQLQIEARQDECSAKMKGKQTFSVMAPEMEILYLVSETDAESDPVAFADKCDEAVVACMADDSHLHIMPENAEELDAYCVKKLQLFQCLLEAISHCENTTDLESFYKETIMVLKHVCDKDSELYKSLLLVIPCIKREIADKKNLKCHDMSEEESTIEKFEKILNDAGLTDVGRDHECFGTYFFDACMIGSHGAICGIEARDVALEIQDLQIEAGYDKCYVNIKGKQTYSVMAPEMEILYLESEAVPNHYIKDTSEEE